MQQAAGCVAVVLAAVDEVAKEALLLGVGAPLAVGAVGLEGAGLLCRALVEWPLCAWVLVCETLACGTLCVLACFSALLGQFHAGLGGHLSGLGGDAAVLGGGVGRGKSGLADALGLGEGGLWVALDWAGIDADFTGHRVALAVRAALVIVAGATAHQTHTGPQIRADQSGCQQRPQGHSSRHRNCGQGSKTQGLVCEKAGNSGGQPQRLSAAKRYGVIPTIGGYGQRTLIVKINFAT